MISNIINKIFFGKDAVNLKYEAENLGLTLTRETLDIDDVFYGSITTTIKDNGKKKRLNNRKDLYKVSAKLPDNKIAVTDAFGDIYKTSIKTITIFNSLKGRHIVPEIEDLVKRLENKTKELEYVKFQRQIESKGVNIFDLSPEEKVSRLVESGMNNIWMVGPAGSGKSTIARKVANEKDLPYLCISCGIGTSATEFVGYKYPSREPTRFAEFYAKPSIILIDEMTALDPAVAQVLNAALANDEIETTTGLVHRHPECIIIATSNTFGTGADRQYVANNQLDASTIDRFIGSIVEVTYSELYESQFDTEVLSYCYALRKIIKDNELRRIVSTRMIIAGHKLKYNGILDWRKLLIVHWTDKEQKIIKDSLPHIEKNIFLKDKDKPYNGITGETKNEYVTRLRQLNTAS